MPTGARRSTCRVAADSSGACPEPGPVPPDAERGPARGGSPYTRPPVTDFPPDLPAALASRLADVLDVEGKLPRTLESLGPVGDRDVLLIGGGELRATQLSGLGGRVRQIESLTRDGPAVPSSQVDLLVACWSAFRDADSGELDEARRLARPGGRLLVVHDYGRDDVSQLYADGPPRPEYGAWSRRDGPFLASGFKVRVVHCWWTFESIDAARAFIGEGFGDAGRRVAAELRRPRLSYNVAVYHRNIGAGAS